MAFGLVFRYGFDSGVMLEYVYRNQPRGMTPLGMLIDWVYLNAQGWRGIRQRSQLLKQTLWGRPQRLSTTRD